MTFRRRARSLERLVRGVTEQGRTTALDLARTKAEVSLPVLQARIAALEARLPVVSSVYEEGNTTLTTTPTTLTTMDVTVPPGMLCVLVLADGRTFAADGETFRERLRYTQPDGTIANVAFDDELMNDVSAAIGDIRFDYAKHWVFVSPAAGLWKFEFQFYKDNSTGAATASVSRRMTVLVL